MEKEPDWEAINRNWQKSGLSQQTYCEKAGVVPVDAEKLLAECELHFKSS